MLSKLAPLYRPFAYLEKFLMHVFEKMPRLPQSLKHFIAKYVWLIVLFDIIMTILLMIFAIFIVSAIDNGAAKGEFVQYMSSHLARLDKAMELAPWYVHVASMVSNVVFYLTIILQIVSIYFLLHRRRLGWVSLYIVALCLLAQDIISLLYPLFNIGDFIFSVLFHLALLYVVFELRSYFTRTGSKKSRATT